MQQISKPKVYINQRKSKLSADPWFNPIIQPHLKASWRILTSYVTACFSYYKTKTNLEKRSLRSSSVSWKILWILLKFCRMSPYQSVYLYILLVNWSCVRNMWQNQLQPKFGWHTFLLTLMQKFFDPWGHKRKQNKFWCFSKETNSDKMLLIYG